jgi:aminoglycoside phosphotransferase (APT) family kinase protein
MKIAMRFQGRFGFRAVALGLYDYPYIQALPFGLLIKTTPRPEQEALATMTAHAMGVPTPRILSYAEVDSPDDPGHILMTAIPGDRLWDAYQGYSAKQLATIATELGGCFRKLGSFTSPYGNAVCGPDGKRVHTRVAPMYDLSMDRFESPRLYHETLISWGEVSDHKPDYSTLLEEAGKLLTKEYRVVFAHGDLHLTNILVKDGHLAGIIDWADAGW